MMIAFLIFSFLLDGILTNYLPFFQETLSLFTPYLSIVAIFLIVPFFRKDEIYKYYKIVFLYGFLYDLFYTNLLMCHVILFLEVAYFSQKSFKNIQMNYITVPLTLLFLIGLYHFSFYLLLHFFNSINAPFPSLIYVFSHSILLNLIYGEIFYFIFHKWNKKYRKR